jgi:hypothetical protein
MRSDVAVALDIAKYNSGRTKIATAATEFAAGRNTIGRNVAEYNGDDSRCPVRNKSFSFVM